MRKVIIGAFISLDGVIQAPGGPEEDPTGGFKFGGWIPPLSSETTGAVIGETFSKPFDLLLGRRTYDIFAAYWPYFDTDPATSDAGHAHIANTFNAATKFVATHRPESLTWRNSKALGPDVAGAIRDLKRTDGPDLIVQGSSELNHILLANGLADELRLLIFPLVFGRGKRLFDQGSMPAAFRLEKTLASKEGVIVANYVRAGEIATGSFGADKPSPAEIERRKNLR